MRAAPSVEKEEAEETKRQAELRRAQEQLKKCLEDEDYTGAAAVKEKIAALTSAAPSIEKEEEEKKRQAELQCAQDQLKKCFENEDYTGAAAVEENIAVLMGAEACSQRKQRSSKADWSAVTAASHGAKLATGPTVASATGPKRVEKEEDEEERSVR
jgi:protein-arginine kinase activator protein McsA